MKTTAVVCEKGGTGKSVIANELCESYVRQGVPASLYSADAAKEHDKKEGKASASTDASEGRATSLVSMTKSDKKRLTAIAKTHGLSLSAFFRLAADEYIANHDW